MAHYDVGFDEHDSSDLAHQIDSFPHLKHWISQFMTLSPKEQTLLLKISDALIAVIPHLQE